MKYLLNGTWVNDSTIAALPDGATALSDAEWDNRHSTPYQPTLTELRAAALADVRAMRAKFFPTLAGLQSEALARGNTADATAIAAVQQGCRDITLTDLSAGTTKAEIEAAFLAAWAAVAGPAPASVKLALKAIKL